MSGLILALQFFTRLPINVNVDFSEKNIKSCFFFLPFVGLIYGGVTAGIMYAFSETAITSLLAVLAYVMLGGSLHIDGLADFADGFAANASPEKTLAIMSDPHSGVFATIAVVLDLLLRFVMYQLLSFNWVVLMLPPLLARVFVLFVVAHGKPAKKTGLGAMFYASISRWTFPIFFVIMFVALIATCYFFALPYAYLALPFINWAIVAIIMFISHKKIGGTTGDVNGAIIEIIELTNLLLCYLLFINF